MTSRRAIIVLALAASVVLLVAAIVWDPAGSETEEAAAPGTGLKVVVLAVDGLDWFILGEYMEAGMLPNLSRIMRSALAVEVEADVPTVPHAGWTMVARGAPLTEQERAKLESSAGARLFGVAPDIVRLVRNAGCDAVAIGWPAAWPTSEEGIAAPYTPSSPDHVGSLAPAFFATAPGQTGDAELETTIRNAVEKNVATIDEEFEARIHAGGCGEGAGDALAAVKWGYLADRIALDVAGRTIAEREPDLALVYLGGLDAATHRFLAPAMPDYFEGVDFGMADCDDVVPNYYTFIDEAIGRLLRLHVDGTLFVVTSAYGTHPSVNHLPATGSHELGPPGVMAVRGPHLMGSEKTPSVRTTDFAPTILAALGLPTPGDLPGRVVEEALPMHTLELFPTALVDREEPAATSEQAPPECDQMEEMVRERLSGLRTAGR